MRIYDDKVIRLTDYKDLFKRLNEFRNYRKPEIKLAEVGKLMEEIGVERLRTGKGEGRRKGQGSKIFYFHPILKTIGKDGNIVIHKKHKKREMIYTSNFKRHVYPKLRAIIELLQMNGEK